MAKIRFVLNKSNIRRDGTCPVCLRITQNGRLKYIDLGLSATVEQWNAETERFKKDRRVVSNYENYNALLNHYEEWKDGILRKFAQERTEWTIERFEEEFVGASKRGKVYDFWMRLVDDLMATGHIGNAKVYARDLHLFCLYDSKAKQRLFSDIDVKYINRLNHAMELNGCCGNTRMHTLKTLRAVINKAIKEKEASSATYPFGKGGFEVGKLAEETEKRYLPLKELKQIKNTPQQNMVLERARRLFLFSYYCFGMSFVDMAHLTNQNIIMLSTGLHIVYKRQKIKNAKNTKPIQIPVTNEIKEQLEWFKTNIPPMGDYLLPIITKNYDGVELYDHVRTRYKRINMNMKKLGKELGIRLPLTTYVSRHSMAMTLQENNMPREVISQALGHKNLTTTNVYLDSFKTEVLDNAARVL